MTMATEKTVMTVIRAGRPTFRNQYDKIAFVVHASFLASDEVPIDRWNELNDEYALVYSNPEKDSKKVLVKCLVINEKLIIDALAEGSSEPVHLAIK
ncbi:hypothetical protein RIF29_29711 [Crotalaria pallida]|uniref:PI31 proteasome regulator N-terminal domain-containing protein n=1 Tax=Crotalaria pallida TaxID=3830 RepID=A0AAN9HXP5_CROPI